MSKEEENKIIVALYNYCSPINLDDFERFGVFVTKIYDYLYYLRCENIEFPFALCKGISDMSKDEEWMKKCAIKFYGKSRKIDEYQTENTYLVTGYVNTHIKDKQKLNYWLETIEESYVIDINRNLVMRKEDYYKVFEPKVLEKRIYQEKETTKK